MPMVKSSSAKLIKNVRAESNDVYDAIVAKNINALKAMPYTIMFAQAPKNDQRLDPIILAMEKGSPEIVDYLVKYHFVNTGSRKLLQAAIKHGNCTLIEIFIQSGCFLRNSYKDSEGNNPLHYVGEHSNPQKRTAMAKQLIEAGINIYRVNDKGLKPKHFAEFVALNYTYKQQYSPKNLFLSFFTVKLVSDNLFLFLYATFWVHPVLSFYSIPFIIGVFTVLFCAYLFASHKDILKKQIENQEMLLFADIEDSIKRDKFNEILLKEYVQQGLNLANPKTSEAILKFATRYDKLDALKLLEQHGAKITMTTLGAAIASHRTKIANYLLDECSIDFKLSEKTNEKTPLFYAIQASNPEFVRRLLNKGAYTGKNTSIAEKIKNLKRIKFISPSSNYEPTFLGLANVHLEERATSSESKKAKCKEIIKLITKANQAPLKNRGLTFSFDYQQSLSKSKRANTSHYPLRSRIAAKRKLRVG